MESTLLDVYLGKTVKVIFIDKSTRTGVLERSKHYDGLYMVGILNFPNYLVSDVKVIKQP